MVTKFKTIYLRRHRTNRSFQGVYMVEILVALILGALLCFVLLQMLSETMRVSSSNANQQNAALFAQTVLDSIKAQNASTLSAGTYTLLTNSTSAGEVASGGHPLPLGLNVGTLKWTDKAVGNKYPGTATLTIQPGTDPTTLDAIVVLKWSDSQSTRTKTVATMTKLHVKGANFW